MENVIDVNERYDLLFFPTLLEYVDYQTLCKIMVLSKKCLAIIHSDQSDSFGFWKDMCVAYSAYRGLFSICLLEDLHDINYKSHLRNELIPLSEKWNVCGDENLEYKIKVSIRFRPGVRGTSKLTVPLHQFLKVKREKTKNCAINEREEKNKQFFVGEIDPTEFCDPFLGTLMKEPVLLSTSGRIVDKSVAINCVVRGRDPFNNKKLSQHMITPQPELANQIATWKLQKKHHDVGLDVKDLKCLADEYRIDPNLLEVLQGVQHINQVSHRLENEIQKPIRTTMDGNDGILDDETMTETDDVMINTTIPETLTAIEQDYPFHVNNTATSNHASSNLRPLSVLDVYAENSLKQAEKARIIEADEEQSVVSMHVPGIGFRPFYFSTVNDESSKQMKIYRRNGLDAISAVLNGFNSCVLCYGQTGSGKTYTFCGPEESIKKLETFENTSDDEIYQTLIDESTGLVLRTCKDLLQAKFRFKNIGISVVYSAHFVEIYDEQVIDLVTGSVVKLRRDNGTVVGAVETPLDSMYDCLKVLRIGHAHKRFAATAMNDRSSRSHTAFIIKVSQKLQGENSVGSHGEMGLCDKLIQSNLYLIDLAGSERIKKSQVTGTTMKETIGINSSLFVLAKVISAQVNGFSHVPYFESKLTTLLKSAFGGNSRTTVIINCRSDDEHGDETLESMRFGERCGMITNAMKQSATSYSSAIKTINNSLENVNIQLKQMREQGKSHYRSYKTLAKCFEDLTKKRDELASLQKLRSAA